MSTGAIIAYIPDGSYQTTTLDPHVTLGYFGDADELEPWQRTVLMGIASDLAETKPYYTKPPKVGGRGTFRIPEENGNGLTYAYIDLIDWNAFPKARAEVEERAGFVDRSHGFTPHMTLTYGNAWIPDHAAPGENYEFKWDSVDVWMGDERISYPIR
jgi:2'-5' RNA ligase